MKLEIKARYIRNVGKIEIDDGHLQIKPNKHPSSISLNEPLSTLDPDSFQEVFQVRSQWLSSELLKFPTKFPNLINSNWYKYN